MLKLTLFYWISFVSIFNICSGNELRVKGPSSIVIQTKSSRTVPGKLALLEINAPLSLWCQAIHATTRQVIAATEIVFFHKNKKYAAEFTDSTNQNATLTLDSVRVHDAGIWTCHVKTESYGSMSGDISVFLRSVVNTTLRVDDKSTLKNHFDLSGKIVVFGENISLECPVFGYPMPSVEWRKNSEQLDPFRTNVLKNGVLFIKNVSYEDDGIYICTAKNSFKHKGQNQHSEITLYRRLRVKSKYAWILPLSIIILIILFLIAIIVSCEFRQRRKLLNTEDE